jgi:hypothetical protein
MQARKASSDIRIMWYVIRNYKGPSCSTRTQKLIRLPAQETCPVVMLEIHVLIGKTSRHINIKGDCRLTTHNRIYQYIYFYLLSYFSNLLVLLVLRCRRCSLLQQWRSPRVVRPARAAHSHRTPLTGSLPGVWGFGSQETSPACLVYRVPGEAPLMTCPAYRAHRRRHTVTCSCVNS